MPGWSAVKLNTFTDFIELWTRDEGHRGIKTSTMVKRLFSPVISQHFIEKETPMQRRLTPRIANLMQNDSAFELVVRYRDSRLCKMDQFREIMSRYFARKSRPDFTFLVASKCLILSQLLAERLCNGHVLVITMGRYISLCAEHSIYYDPIISILFPLSSVLSFQGNT